MTGHLADAHPRATDGACCVGHQLSAATTADVAVPALMWQCHWHHAGGPCNTFEPSQEMHTIHNRFCAFAVFTDLFCSRRHKCTTEHRLVSQETVGVEPIAGQEEIKAEPTGLAARTPGWAGRCTQQSMVGSPSQATLARSQPPTAEKRKRTVLLGRCRVNQF